LNEWLSNIRNANTAHARLTHNFATDRNKRPMVFTVPTLILLFAMSTVALPAARKKFFPEIAICNKREARSNLKPSQTWYILAYNVMTWDEMWFRASYRFKMCL